MNKKVETVRIGLQQITEQSLNEIFLNLDLNEFKKLLKKYTRNSKISEKILSSSTDICAFDDIRMDCSSLLYYSKASGKLILNNIHEDNEDSLRINKNFFLELSKHSLGNFKVYYLDRDLWDLVFCVYINGELFYTCQNVSDWEDPLYFETVPYFIELAKDQGMKKKRTINGKKVYDSEEIYDLIYEFRDILASRENTYLKIAPDWFLNMASISH